MSRTLSPLAALALLALPAATWAESAAPATDTAADSHLTVHAEAELGYLGVFAHIVQFSGDGSEIDYRREGGQDVLFPFARLSAELGIGSRHRISFLYQPLEINTQEVLRRDLVIDGAIFEAGTPMAFRYSFPFWRASWLYDLIEDPRHEASLGASLQLRNATIEFSDLAGEQLRTTRDIGPVPLLKFRGRWGLPHNFFAGAELDGIYAPVSYLNGSDTEITGALLDAQLRGGLALGTIVPAEVFVGWRYLGGGAVGTDDDDIEPGFGDGYVRNWLHFWTTSLGVRVKLL
jgi:hypothetical protein